ncbi:MAG: sigma-70 family RNA polymerase sigma factor, partial [Caulobacteraceae bacterium]|nr:sigma-70 family RNA polymerase sigma factor [Caulobacter sp.]
MEDARTAQCTTGPGVCNHQLSRAKKMNLAASAGHEVETSVPPIVPAICPPASDGLAAARAGDADAFGALIADHAATLLGRARALCRDDGALAEDLAQETLVEAWKSLSRYDETRCRLATWLYAILLHRHRKALRRARVRPFFCLDAAARDAALRRLRALEGSPAEALAGRERAAELRRAVAALPRRHAEVIRLR